MMKMIHCADLHLDAKLSAHLPIDKIESRKAELLHTFLRMIDFANDHDVKAILISGDLYDTNQVSVTARNTFVEAVLRNPQIDFYYLRGNHDTESNFQKQEQMPKNLKLFKESWTSYGTGRNHNIVITGAELTEKNSSAIFDQLQLEKDKIHIVMLHGQEMTYQGKDKTAVIPLRMLKNKGIDYLALGHVHEYKWDELDGRGIWCYPGCLEGRGFDECGEHGFVLLTIDEENRKVSHEFVPFAYRKVYTLPVDISECMTTFDVSDRINQELVKGGVSETGLVKIILTGARDVSSELNMVLLRELFEPDFYFFKICDESGYRVDYKEYALDASLKGEFVRMVMDEDTMKEEEKADVIRYGLLALSGEEIE